MSPVSLGGVTLYSLVELRESFPAKGRPSLETLRRLVRSGALGGRKVGNNWLVSRGAIEVYFRVPGGSTDAPAVAARLPAWNRGRK